MFQLIKSNYIKLTKSIKGNAEQFALQLDIKTVTKIQFEENHKNARVSLNIIEKQKNVTKFQES